MISRDVRTPTSTVVPSCSAEGHESSRQLEESAAVVASPLPRQPGWTHLPVLCLRMELRMQDHFRLPPFAGSTFRGARGWALKKVCPPPVYRYLFETASDRPGQTDASRPFILCPPTQGRDLKVGQRLSVELKLLGQGCEHLADFVEAVMLAGEHGLGKQKARFELVKIVVHDGTRPWVCFDAACGWEGAYQPMPSALGAFARVPFAVPDQLTLVFETPTRLVWQGEPLTTPDFPVVMRALYRRLNALLDVHGASSDSLTLLGQMEELEETWAQHDVEWMDWERRSNRQQRRHVMGGLVGTSTYHGHFRREWLELLAAGQVLHLGKATTFGMGRYRLILP